MTVFRVLLLKCSILLTHCLTRLYTYGLRSDTTYRDQILCIIWELEYPRGNFVLKQPPRCIKETQKKRKEAKIKETTKILLALQQSVGRAVVEPFRNSMKRLAWKTD